MDPDATWALVNDESSDLDERAVAATDLLCWLAMSGFQPRGTALAFVTDECRYRIFKALDRLAELEDA